MSDGAAAAYSSWWFETFLERIPADVTHAQVAFLERQLPLPEFTRVLDVPCGRGRHAAPLAARGYAVTGVDLDHESLRIAAARAPSARFVRADLRAPGAIAGAFDAVLCLWASFGWFDDAGDAACLAALGGRLRPGGRMVLDVYHPRAFDSAPAEDRRTAGRLSVVTRTRQSGRRVTVEIEYAGAPARDRFEWRLYEEAELGELAGRSGLALVLACSRFDERSAPAAEHRHVQYVLERR